MNGRKERGEGQREEEVKKGKRLFLFPPPPPPTTRETDIFSPQPSDQQQQQQRLSSFSPRLFFRFQFFFPLSFSELAFFYFCEEQPSVFIFIFFSYRFPGLSPPHHHHHTHTTTLPPLSARKLPLPSSLVISQGPASCAQFLVYARGREPPARGGLCGGDCGERCLEEGGCCSCRGFCSWGCRRSGCCCCLCRCRRRRGVLCFFDCSLKRGERGLVICFLGGGKVEEVEFPVVRPPAIRAPLCFYFFTFCHLDLCNRLCDARRKRHGHRPIYIYMYI